MNVAELPTLFAPLPQRINRLRLQPRDKFPANAVSWIVARLKNGHRHACPSQRHAQGQSREAAADDLNALQREFHGRAATRRYPPNAVCWTW